MEENDDIIVLEDENGDQLEFEYLSHLDYEGQKYIVLCPKTDEEEIDDENDDDEMQVVILKIFLDENSQEIYEPLEEEEAERVFAEFLRIQENQEG